MRSLVLLLFTVLISGCMSFSDRHFRPVKDSLVQQMPDLQLKKEMALTVGSGLFNLVDLVDGSDVNLSKIDHVRVAVYKVFPRQQTAAFSDVIFDLALLAQDNSLTWERIVRVREDQEQVWIYAGMDLVKQRLDALSVFVLERDELVLINMGGDLDSLLQYALEPARGHRRGRPAAG